MYLLFRQGLMQPSLTETCYVAEDYLKPITFLPPPPKCWDYRTGRPSLCDGGNQTQGLVRSWQAHHSWVTSPIPWSAFLNRTCPLPLTALLQTVGLKRGKRTIRLMAWVEPWDTASTLTSLATLVGVAAVGWMLRKELSTAFHIILVLSFCHGHKHFSKPNMDYE